VVFFNYTTMQVSAKIVYYGPGLCGKTTNLQQIHGRTDPGSRGEMVSLETEADRTLFFDLLPLEVGTIGGMRVRLQLYTVPGQVFYNTTRKLVLKGVDGIVFVADSQEPMLDANIESLQNLKKNLAELNQPLEKIPFVFQFNKRDLRNILAVETMNRHLNREGYEVYEGAALHGVGVFETLKAISRKTLAAVHRKISGEEEPPAPVRRAARLARVPAEPKRPKQDVETQAVAPGDALFAELEDELDPNAVAITEPAAAAEKKEAIEIAEPEPELEPQTEVDTREEDVSHVEPILTTASAEESNTAEVKVEFALNPAVAEPPSEQASVPNGPDAPPNGPVKTVRTVETKSKLDIERELEKLREMAFGGARSKKGAAPGPAISLTGKGTASIPSEVWSAATGLVVDVRLVGEGSSHTAPGVVRLELPPRAPGESGRVRLEIDLESEKDE
jgi:signal recognition particle receptor subunit beta